MVVISFAGVLPLQQPTGTLWASRNTCTVVPVVKACTTVPVVVSTSATASRTSTPSDPAVARQRGYCRSLRDALAAIPGAAPAAAAEVLVERPPAGG